MKDSNEICLQLVPYLSFCPKIGAPLSVDRCEGICLADECTSCEGFGLRGRILRVGEEVAEEVSTNKGLIPTFLSLTVDLLNKGD